MYGVIGYGNALRRDDGAGLVLAQEIAALLARKGQRVLHRLVHQLTPELIYEFVEAECIIFVDTGVADDDPMVCVTPVLSQGEARTVGHQMAPEMFLVLLEKFLNIFPPAWMVRVPGWDFCFGEEISTKTKHALMCFLKQLEQDWQSVFNIHHDCVMIQKGGL